MAFINYGNLVQLMENVGAEATCTHLTEALKEKKLNPRDFSIRELAEAFLGREWVQNLHPRAGSRRFVTQSIQESSATAVAFSQFSNITGQLFFSTVMEAYEAEEFVFSKIIPDKQTPLQDMEKIPGITNIGDEAEVVSEGNPYPTVGVSENYIEIGPKAKRGHIVEVTREAIFGDKTSVLLERCRAVGEFLGLNKEKRLIDAVIDENGGGKSAVLGGHRYHWQGTSYATYQATSPWINVKTSNGLVDWTDVEAAELLLADMIDPFTGEPIMIRPTHIIVTPQNLHTARRVTSATEIRNTAGGFATSGNPMQTSAPNTLDQYQVLSSRLLKARAATDDDWWFGNPSRAVNYFSNWNIETSEAPPNDKDAFDRDVVSKFKASEKGIAATVEPRVLVENRA